MKSFISKSIKEVKEDIGIHFFLNTHFEDLRNHNNEVIEKNFMKIWVCEHRLSFKDKVDLLYKIFTGMFKDNGLYLNVNEGFNANYAICKEYQSSSIFTTLDNVKKYILGLLLYDLDFLLGNKNQNKVINSLKKDNDNIFKKALLKSSLGKKINYLIENQKIIRSMSFDDLMNVRIKKEYDNEEDKVILPSDWNKMIKNDFSLNFFSFNVFKNVSSHIYKADYNKKTKSMDIIFESNIDFAYNFQHLFFDEDKEDFIFNEECVYLSKNSAKVAMNEMILEYENKANKIKKQIIEMDK